MRGIVSKIAGKQRSDSQVRLYVSADVAISRQESPHS